MRAIGVLFPFSEFGGPGVPSTVLDRLGHDVCKHELALAGCGRIHGFSFTFTPSFSSALRLATHWRWHLFCCFLVFSCCLLIEEARPLKGVASLGASR